MLAGAPEVFVVACMLEVIPSIHTMATNDKAEWLPILTVLLYGIAMTVAIHIYQPIAKVRTPLHA